MTPELWEKAIEQFDWGQPVGRDWNPCFAIFDGQCCGRAKRWPGHEPGHDHEHVSLLQFIRGRTPDLTEALARLKALEDGYRRDVATMEKSLESMPAEPAYARVLFKQEIEKPRRLANEIAAIRKAMGARDSTS